MLEGHAVEDDGKTWKLTLRDGLAFHDGSKVLGRDCAASIQRWAKRDTFGQALLAATDEISAPDDRTILIRLKYPFPVADAIGKSSGNMCAMMPERIAQHRRVHADQGDRRQRAVPVQGRRAHLRLEGRL